MALRLFLLVPGIAVGAMAFAPPYAVLQYRQFAALVHDTEARPDIRNYSAWAENNVPLLDFPDGDIQTAYYYRWRLFREHIESTTAKDLALIDEFLPEPGGRGPISCAAGHHFADGMWLRDASVLDDVSEYWFELAGDTLYQYTHWIGSSALRRQVLRGDVESGAMLLDRLVMAWRGGSVGKTSYTGYAEKYLDSAGKCWWQVDDRDGMEFGISGNGCRPTINAVLYGEAQAVVELAAWLGNESIVQEFQRHREFSRAATLALWNPEIVSFATVPRSVPSQLAKPGGPKPWPDIDFVQNIACNLTAVRALNGTVGVRELLGFTPWYYSKTLSPLIPPKDVGTYLPMFEQLLDSDGFAGVWGLTTAERRHKCYNYSWDKECGKSAHIGTCGNSSQRHGSNRNTWNANSWPYESSRVLASFARVLQGVEYANVVASDRTVNKETYYVLLRQFAKQHTRTLAVDENSGQDARIGENLHPDLGYWNTRYWRAQAGEHIGATYRGNDYFHSSYLDLVINGLIGLDASKRSADGLKLTLIVTPLVPESANVSHFCLDGVRTAAHDITVVYDATGAHYRRGKGLLLLVDGTIVASATTLSRIAATIEDGPMSPPLPTPPRAKPPPPPPSQPVVGWTQLTNLTGEFCCDGLATCRPTLLRETTQATCMTKAVQARAHYVTTTSIPGKSPGCFIAKQCEKQGKYIDTPSPSYIRTWRRDDR